jgi:uncharacterized membrane protein YuzA (DUF378 family)
MDTITKLILIIGGLNWGLIGLVNKNYIELLLGNGEILNSLYIIIGLVALYVLYNMFIYRENMTSFNDLIASGPSGISISQTSFNDLLASGSAGLNVLQTSLQASNQSLLDTKISVNLNGKTYTLPPNCTNITTNVSGETSTISTSCPDNNGNMVNSTITLNPNSTCTTLINNNGILSC